MAPLRIAMFSRGENACRMLTTFTPSCGPCGAPHVRHQSATGAVMTSNPEAAAAAAAFVLVQSESRPLGSFRRCDALHMGQERPVMEDDGLGTRTCQMPTLEAEEKAKWPLGSSLVEASLRNCDRRMGRGRGKFLRDQEEEKGALEQQVGEGRDAEDDDNNNCNEGRGGGRARSEAVDFLRGTLPAWTSAYERGDPDAEGAHGDNSAGQPGQCGSQNEPPSAESSLSDLGRFDLCSLFDVRRDSAVASVRSSVKEHLYCTVYCIANERRHDALATSASGEGFVLHTAEDLVKPLRELSLRRSRRRRSSRQASDDDDDTAAEAQTCRVCLEDKSIAPLPCCGKLVCDECLTLYVISQVQEGKTRVRCPISECSGMLEDGAVESRLAGRHLQRYRYFLQLSQLDAGTKPCPRCARFTTLAATRGPERDQRKCKYKVSCGGCQLVWCFKCHAPWHQGIKCRDYRKGDKQLRTWAGVIERGQRNAQKCPKCKIHIQRTQGCDHMICTQCNTNFCYRCGERYLQVRYFGDHTSNLSVFGCKYRYLPHRPHLRRFIRGSVCGAKLLVAPLVLVLVLVLGAVALVLGVIGFPIYYVCKKRKKRRRSSGSWRF
ncbi:E3 ubiquitin-protein ligase RNF217 [Festucalex cinctus]